MKLTHWLKTLKERLDKKYRCSCCDNFTLRNRDWYICPVCGWQYDIYDEEYDDEDSEIKPLLNEAKVNYQLIGAVDEETLRSVRKPYEYELGYRLNRLGQQVRRKRNHIGILPQIWYGPFVLIIVGLVACLFFTKVIVSEIHFKDTAIFTYGRTVSQRLVHGWPEIMMENDPYYTRMVTVEFNTVDTKQLFRFEVGSDELGIGQKVEVIYDPTNPKHAEIKGWRSDLGWEIGLLTLSACVIGVGILWMAL